MKRIRSRQYKKRLWTMAMLILIFAAGLYGYDRYTRFHRLPPDLQQMQLSIGIPITEQLIPQGNKGRPGITREVKWIVIHETANHSTGADAAAHSVYILKHSINNALSWHYTVDDREIYHHLPDNEVGWHAGDSLYSGGGNACGIGIEICVNDDGDYEAALKNAAKLTAHLLDHYDLDTDHVKQHADFMNKNCPQILRDAGRWDEFMQLIQQNRT